MRYFRIETTTNYLQSFGGILFFLTLLKVLVVPVLDWNIYLHLLILAVVCVLKCPFGIRSILVTPERQLCYLLGLIMVFKTVGKTLIGIPHIHLIHSLNPCTNEEHGALFISSGAVCFPLHNTLGPNLQEMSQGHSFIGIRCSCLALRFEHVTRYVFQHQQI